MRLGAHVSIAGGCAKAPARARDLGCETFQIFSRSPRGLRNTPALSPEEGEAFKQALRANGFDGCLIHANYLINLAAATPEQLELGRRELAVELERAQTLGGQNLVVHPGAHMGGGEDKAVRLVAESLDWALENAAAADVVICLENTAGQGSAVGYHLEHLRDILAAARYPRRLAVCIDTCHALAAGYELRDGDSYAQFVERIGATVGLDRVSWWHLNDCEGELGCRKDRHANIGAGSIGAPAFARLLNDPRFQGRPACLETPGGDDEYRRELTLLKTLREMVP
ncbi:MAG: deoxyribonuclease IV [Candidatus Schekmanbacteria bacterium]|nr:deoxyribonuclease IV [Candidatus Schekmanbacteria bacterium]